MLEQEEELREFFDIIAEISAEFAGQEIAVFARIGSAIASAFEEGKITAESALGAIAATSMAIFDNISERQEKNLSDNEKAREAELELAGENEAAKLLINEEFDKKQNEIKLKQFKADKARAITDIAIQGALAVVKALPNIPLSIATGISAAAAGVLVASKKPPVFGGGTPDIVNIGGSHASGNDTDVFGFSGGQKQYFGKVEKGEAMPVIRKSAINDYNVMKLNGAFSPSGRKFANGTPDITSTPSTVQSIEVQTRNNEQLAAIVVDAIKGVKITAFIEDITKAAVKKMEIESNGQF